VQKALRVGGADPVSHFRRQTARATCAEGHAAARHEFADGDFHRQFGTQPNEMNAGEK
jgi:hypothetical protein